MAKFFCLYFGYVDYVGFGGYVICLAKVVIVCDNGGCVNDVAVFVF